ncbi:MAG TPA: NAD(P)-dependent oxidoreductase [Bacteroidia bacterium]|jgi:UDP-glucose 4-epimerase|nr:NAD(P)-dependent oxidoreductase [Bacteroidia bacterium]
MILKKNILVFGGAGFIGTYLIDELLKQNHTVVASDINNIGEKYYHDNNIPYVAVDITNKTDFEKLPNVKFDVVINLAALQPANYGEKKYEPGDYININVVGTLNILEFCRKTEVKKIIYASSHRNTSGLWHENRAIKEEDGRSQQYSGEYSMFSISESAAQDCVEYYRANYNMQGIIFRLPPVYGFGPHLEIFKNGKPMKTGFQTFIDNAMACKPLEVWGDSNRGRDIIYVKDVVSAFIKAIMNDKVGGLYNISSAVYLTLKEEVKTIASVFWGSDTEPVIIELPDRPLAMDSFLYDNSKAKKELDWAPQYNFEALLRDYIKEKDANRFGFLIEKRKEMFQKNQ